MPAFRVTFLAVIVRWLRRQSLAGCVKAACDTPSQPVCLGSVDDAAPKARKGKGYEYEDPAHDWAGSFVGRRGLRRVVPAHRSGGDGKSDTIRLWIEPSFGCARISLISSRRVHGFQTSPQPSAANWIYAFGRINPGSGTVAVRIGFEPIGAAVGFIDPTQCLRKCPWMDIRFRRRGWACARRCRRRAGTCAPALSALPHAASVRGRSAGSGPDPAASARRGPCRCCLQA